MTEPSTVLPPEARAKLKADAEAIKRYYRTELLRSAALEVALKQLREQYPFAFRDEVTHGSA